MLQFIMWNGEKIWTKKIWIKKNLKKFFFGPNIREAKSGVLMYSNVLKIHF